MAQQYDIIIVGGGIVGLGTAYKMQLHHPNLKILVLEKEEKLAKHQTGRNSGVIHSGIYYKPGSLKAKNCVVGRRELVKFCEEHKVAYDVCGKIIVATDESELPFLEKIYNLGIENQIEDIEKIGVSQIKEIEPHCAGIQAVRVGCTGIVDFVGMVNKMAELVVGINPESKVLTNQKVINIVKGIDGQQVITETATFHGKHLIFCGGLFSDRLAKMDQVKTDAQIVGFRGDYYDLTEQGLHKVRNLIYPVPNPAFPFLGVHFTRMIHGGVECGPNAVFTFKREGYNKTDFNLQDTWEALTFGGTWKLFFKHWRFGLDEYRRAFSKKLFLSRLQKLIPSLTMDDITEGRAGVRAMALGNDGAMIDDFKIEYAQNSLHVLNAPSPAATAGLAIGDEVRIMAEKQFQLL
ncbi:MAG: L-2-hydroxyglutarate oxidase [Bacteroidia bacterium]